MPGEGEPGIVRVFRVRAAGGWTWIIFEQSSFFQLPGSHGKAKEITHLACPEELLTQYIVLYTGLL